MLDKNAKMFVSKHALVALVPSKTMKSILFPWRPKTI